MAEKHTDNSKYNHSHQKNAKREVKHLTRSIAAALDTVNTLSSIRSLIFPKVLKFFR